MLNIHAYKKTKIAIYDEKHSKHNNCSQWQQVTINQHRKAILELLKHSKALKQSPILPKTNRSSQVQSDVEIEFKTRVDKRRRYEEFHKDCKDDVDDNNDNTNVERNYHRTPAAVINENLTTHLFVFFFFFSFFNQ